MIGGLTGVASAWPIFIFTPIPGFLFGLNFLTWRKASGARVFAMVLAGLAYYVAMMIGVRAEHSDWAYTGASLCGAALLWISLMVTRVIEARLRGFAQTLLLSVFASLPFMMIKDGGNTWWFLSFFVWQAMMAAWLAYLAERKAAAEDTQKIGTI